MLACLSLSVYVCIFINFCLLLHFINLCLGLHFDGFFFTQNVFLVYPKLWFPDTLTELCTSLVFLKLKMNTGSTCLTLLPLFLFFLLGNDFIMPSLVTMGVSHSSCSLPFLICCHLLAASSWFWLLLLLCGWWLMAHMV